MSRSPDGMFFYGYVGRTDMEYCERPHSLWTAEYGDEGYDEADDEENEDGESARDRYDGDVIDEIAKSRGGVSPFDFLPYPRSGYSDPNFRQEQDAWREATKDVSAAWDELRKQIKAEIGADKVDIGHNGYEEFSGEYVYIKEAHHQVEWSEVKQVTDLTINPDWDVILQRYINVMGIKPEYLQGPGWFLVCRYG